MFTLYFLQKAKCYPYVCPIIDYNIELQYKWIQLKPVSTAKEEYQFSSSKHIFGGDPANTSPKPITAPPKQKISPPPSVQQKPETDSEYAIHSAEEARKAIIWSEILQRKY